MYIHMSEPIFFLCEAFTTEFTHPWFDTIWLMRCLVHCNALGKSLLISPTDDETALVTRPFEFYIWRQLMTRSLMLDQFGFILVYFATLVTRLIVN